MGRAKVALVLMNGLVLVAGALLGLTFAVGAAFAYADRWPPPDMPLATWRLWTAFGQPFGVALAAVALSGWLAWRGRVQAACMSSLLSLLVAVVIVGLLWGDYALVRSP